MTEPDRLEALKPCPFGCEGAPILHRIPGAPKLWKVSCVNCDSGRSGRFSEAAITAWNTRPIETNTRTGDAAEGSGASPTVATHESPDVIRLVIAARIVAFEDQSPEALRELDQASEAFASRVPWDDEPAPAPQSITPPEVGGGWLPIPEHPEPMVHFHVWHKLWDGVRVGYYDAKVKWWLLRDMKTAEWSGAGVFPSHYRRITSETTGRNLPDPPEVGGELVERVARAICGKDDPDELVPAGNPLGEYAEYPRWMLFQLDAKKIISDPRSGLESLATWFRFDATNGEFTGEYCSVKPHDAHGMEPMVRINYALAIATLSTPEVVDGTAGLVDALERAQVQFEAIGISYGNGADAAHLMHMASVGQGQVREALSQHRGVS